MIKMIPKRQRASFSVVVLLFCMSCSCIDPATGTVSMALLELAVRVGTTVLATHMGHSLEKILDHYLLDGTDDHNTAEFVMVDPHNTQNGTLSRSTTFPMRAGERHLPSLHVDDPTVILEEHGVWTLAPETTKQLEQEYQRLNSKN